MKVLVLSQYFWPESFRINEVVESLRRVGCHITVLTGQPNYPQGKVFEGYRSSFLGTQHHISGYDIYRVPLISRGRAGSLELIVNYLCFVLTASLLGPWLLRKQRFDVIFVYAPSPIIQAIPAVWIAFLKRAKLITWVQDLWPQSLEATGFLNNNILLNMVEVLVSWIYRRCDLLLVQSRSFLEPVKSMAGKTPVLFHPNPGDLALNQRLKLRLPALQLGHGFNVLFAGNFGKVQALGTVLDAANLLLANKDVRFVLVGSGRCSDWLKQEVISRKLINVQLVGRFPPEAMPGILDQASALLLSLVGNQIMNRTVPSKVQTYLAAGKPIIASLDGEGARVVVESGAGLSCPAEDAKALAEVVLRLRAMSAKELQMMGEAGQLYFKKHFDPHMLAKRLARIFSAVSAGKEL